jgi:hypothetical protein
MPWSLVRTTWAYVPQNQWRQALADGWIETAAAPVEVPDAAHRWRLNLPDPEGLEAVVRPDPCVWDGRFANLGWLQELPKPISTLTWSNVVGLIATAGRTGRCAQWRRRRSGAAGPVVARRGVDRAGAGRSGDRLVYRLWAQSCRARRQRLGLRGAAHPGNRR